MLPTAKRLNLKKDFKWVASGKKIESKFAKIFIKQGENSFPKIGIATSGKVFKKATDRNRSKRLISKAFEVLYPNLPLDINIVALPKVGVINVKSDEVLKDLKEVLKKESVILSERESPVDF